jgi:hypothetical protein
MNLYGIVNTIDAPANILLSLLSLPYLFLHQPYQK